MIKKINYETASYIMSYKKLHPIQKYFCTWTVEQTESGGYNIECKLNFVVFILIFIPFNIIQIFYNILFTGILKGSYFTDRYVTGHRAACWDYASDRVREKHIF